MKNLFSYKVYSLERKHAGRAPTPRVAPAKSSFTQDAYERLRADLLACRLQPGSRLKTNELCHSPSVSLSAVREVLSRLTSEKLAKRLLAQHLEPTTRVLLEQSWAAEALPGPTQRPPGRRTRGNRRVTLRHRSDMGRPRPPACFQHVRNHAGRPGQASQSSADRAQDHRNGFEGSGAGSLHAGARRLHPGSQPSD